MGTGAVGTGTPMSGWDRGWNLRKTVEKLECVGSMIEENKSMCEEVAFSRWSVNVPSVPLLRNTGYATVHMAATSIEFLPVLKVVESFVDRNVIIACHY